MKNYVYIVAYIAITLITAASCNSAANIDKSDICGKEFSQTIKDPMYDNLSKTTTTTFNCDGSFVSGEAANLDDPSAVHQAEFKSEHPHFTGKWEIVKNIPDDVKQAVIAYGLEKGDNNYSIIKYSSSNGISGYCLYNETNSKGTISALNTGQVSQYDWGHVSGAAGIFDGFLKN